MGFHSVAPRLPAQQRRVLDIDLRRFRYGSRSARGPQARPGVDQCEIDALRDPAQGWGGYDSRPAAVKNFLAYTLQRLGVDYIDIYRPARLDPDVPIEETVGLRREARSLAARGRRESEAGRLLRSS
jgi:hypothetical protein